MMGPGGWGGFARAVLMAALAGVAAHAEDGGSAPATTRVLRLMTFNVRVGYIPEGENGWKFRRPLVAEVIRSRCPDLVGTQECTALQAREMLEDLPDYRAVGKPKAGAELSGLMNVIFYRHAELTPVERGVYWHSDHPDQPGSLGWGNQYPRTTVWCRFRRQGGGEILFVNTHLDHACEPARARAGALMAQRLAGVDRAAPIVVTGDFNCSPESDAVRALTRAVEEGGGGLQDLLRVLRPDAKDDGTYHAYRGDGGERRIDFVLASRALQPIAGEVVKYGKDGRYPSDHFPVCIEVRWPAAVGEGAGVKSE